MRTSRVVVAVALVAMVGVPTLLAAPSASAGDVSSRSLGQHLCLVGLPPR